MQIHMSFLGYHTKLMFSDIVMDYRHLSRTIFKGYFQGLFSVFKDYFSMTALIQRSNNLF